MERFGDRPGGCGCTTATPSYIHLKLIPGASFDPHQAGRVADRSRLNLGAKSNDWRRWHRTKGSAEAARRKTPG